MRWSENGKFLASGGDDKVIMIWQISRYVPELFVRFVGKGRMRRWQSLKFRGHTGHGHLEKSLKLE